MSTRVRAIAGAIAVLSFLVFLNFTQVDDDNEAIFRNSGVMSNTVDRVIHERQNQVVSDAIYEGVALMCAGSATIVAVGGGRLLRMRPTVLAATSDGLASTTHQ